MIHGDSDTALNSYFVDLAESGSWQNPITDPNDVAGLLLECGSGSDSKKLVNKLISDSRFTSGDSTGEDRINVGISQSLEDINRLGRGETRNKLIINGKEIDPSKDLRLGSSEEYIESFAGLLDVDLKNKGEENLLRNFLLELNQGGTAYLIRALISALFTPTPVIIPQSFAERLEISFDKESKKIKLKSTDILTSFKDTNACKEYCDENILQIKQESHFTIENGVLKIEPVYTNFIPSSDLKNYIQRCELERRGIDFGKLQNEVRKLENKGCDSEEDKEQSLLERLFAIISDVSPFSSGSMLDKCMQLEQNGNLPKPEDINYFVYLLGFAAECIEKKGTPIQEKNINLRNQSQAVLDASQYNDLLGTVNKDLQSNRNNAILP